MCRAPLNGFHPSPAAPAPRALFAVCMDGFLTVPSLANHNWGAGYTITVSFRVPRLLHRRSVLLSNGPAPYASFWVELVPEVDSSAQAGAQAPLAPSLHLVIGGSTHRLRGAAPPGMLTTSRTAPWSVNGDTTLQPDTWVFLAVTFDPRDGGSVRVVGGEGDCTLNSTNVRFPEGLDGVGVPTGTPLVLGAATEDGLHSFCGAVHELRVRGEDSSAVCIRVLMRVEALGPGLTLHWLVSRAMQSRTDLPCPVLLGLYCIPRLLSCLPVGCGWGLGGVL